MSKYLTAEDATFEALRDPTFNAVRHARKQWRQQLEIEFNTPITQFKADLIAKHRGLNSQTHIQGVSPEVAQIYFRQAQTMEFK